MHSNTLLTTSLALSLTLLNAPITALPLRLSAPSLPFEPPQQQRPFIATTWTSNPVPNHRKFSASKSSPADPASYPHPSALATSTPLPIKDQKQQDQQQQEEEEEEEDDKDDEPIYGPICNLGHRTPVHIEDAVEVANALCQGGIMDRSVVPTQDGEGEEEVLECLACEWGSWNADKGTENK